MKELKMLTDNANKFYAENLDEKGRNAFEKLIRARDIRPNLYEPIVWILGALGLHRLLLKQYKTAFIHGFLAVGALASAAEGVLFFDETYLLIALAGILLCATHWIYSIARIRHDILSFRINLENEIMEKIVNLSEEKLLS
jgi:hypothetical protein